MTFTIILKPWAEEDILDAAKWYSIEQPDLGLKFSKAVSEKLLIIKTSPYFFQLKTKTIRAAFVASFPYGVYYTVEKDLIIVHAVLHAKRSPGIWKKRTRR